MSIVRIDDLPQSEELDAQARRQIYGGSSVGQGIGNGGALGFSYVKGGSIFSPTVNVQTVVSAPVSVQVASLLKQVTEIDTTTIVASVVDRFKV